MTEYNILNVELSNLQLNKSKSGKQNGTEAALKLWSNLVGYSNEENLPQKLSVTNTQVSRLRKAFANGWSANIKLLKSQLHKIGEPGGFLGRLLGPSLKIGLPLTGNYSNR